MLKTFGTVLLEPGRNPRWIIKNLRPHVAIAFKRLFPRVDQYAIEFAISDNEDVRADLYWFMQRYPLETKHMAMLRAGDQAVKDRAAKRGEILTPDWKKTARQLTETTGGDWEGYLQGVADEHAPIKRFGSPEELANFFVFLCSDRASYSVGSTYFVDGGMLRTV